MQYLKIIIKFCAFAILPALIPACQPTSETGRNSATAQTDSCISNPKHTYKIFIPAHKNNNKLPLLVAIDSHGSGQMAIQHLKEAATSYPAILIASNLIQNNDPNYMQELETLIADVKRRHPVGKLTYLTGFSGGARMVLSYAATHHHINGVIACGAFAGNKQISAIQSPVIGLIGTDDFNFSETTQYLFNPTNAPKNAHIELIHATHEWPSQKRLTNVFGWLYLSNKLNKNVDKRQIKNYIKGQNIRIDSLTEKGELLQAVCIARNMASANVFNNIGAFHKKNKILSENTDYRKQLSQMLKSLQFEFEKRRAYKQALFNRDQNWWEKEISDLRNNIQSEPNEMKRMACKRLKGFLGILCYSYSQRFIALKDIPHLEQILMVYQLTEPENTDMKDFLEILEKFKQK